MKIDWRVLRFVGEIAIVLCAGVVVVHTRPSTSGTEMIERMLPGAVASAEANPRGVAFWIGRDALTVDFPSCNMEAFKDRFFLHVYADAVVAGKPSLAVNRDFDATLMPKRHVHSASGEHCVIDRSYGATAAEVVFGQFTMPHGQCCTILWSRDFVLRAK
jgi:hypothetical protein